jgi:hypothetical protein
MPNHVDMLYGLEHANELLREVEKDRLARQALASRRACSPLRRWLRVWSRNRRRLSSREASTCCG